MFARSCLIIISLILINCLVEAAVSSCRLPSEWYGKWYQSKYTDLKGIDKTNFINRGQCIENRMDKYIFYEPEDNCYRCIFIMQKHKNVLQYRASYCTESSDFDMNCNNLTPESELMTIYRHDSVPEKCPLGGLYVMSKPPQIQIQNTDARSYRDTFNPSVDSNCKGTADNIDSKIMECSDDSMLKLQFGKCTNMPTFIVQCSAHWTEGNTNYLIGKVFENSTQTSAYRCFAYTEISSPEDRRNQYRSNSDFINPSTNAIDDDYSDKSTLQIHVSQYEFCRNIDNVIDEQFSFTFNKVQNSKNYVAPPSTRKRSSHHKRQITTHGFHHNSISLKSIHSRHSSHHHRVCRFPRWFNKQWHDLQKSKLYMLNVRLDSLQIIDDKSSITINKYTCEQMQLKRIDSVRAVVKSLNGCNIGYQCLNIEKKSEFVLEIKLGKINYETADIDCNDEDYISKEFVFVDTAYGVTCPLKNGLYEKIDAKASSVQKALLVQDDTQFKFHNKRQEQEPCKQFTQTQTLQVGCQNNQQYSLRTKLCYPNQAEQTADSVPMVSKKPQFTQIESEINLVCLAHWKENGNHVIVSRTMANEILCSTWSSSHDDKFLQLLAIDSKCNYSDMSEKKVDYSFIFLNGCDSQARYSSSSFSSSSILGADDRQSAEAIASSSSAASSCFNLPQLSTYLFYLIIFYKSLGSF